MSQTFINESSKTLADYTAPALIVPQLRSDGPKAVIAELCALLEREGRLVDSAVFYDAVMAREQMSSTSIPRGWALPHARLNGLPQLSFTLARTSRPLIWPGAVHSAVQMVFLFAAPESEAKAYLNLISAVARLSQNPNLVEQLRRAPDAGNMFRVLQQVALRQPRPLPASLAASSAAR